jgi:multiple sugar transport system substrate-binding protein
VTITLKGMTWNHPRGYDPMVAARAAGSTKPASRSNGKSARCRISRHFRSRSWRGSSISSSSIIRMSGRSPMRNACCRWMWLDAKASAPQMAAPVLGNPIRAIPGRAANGPSRSMRQRRCRPGGPDLQATPPATWTEVIELARAGQSPHPAAAAPFADEFLYAGGNLGQPCAVEGPGELIDIETGIQVFEMLREIAALVDPACFEMDPIAVLRTNGSTRDKSRRLAADLWLCQLFA